MDHWWEKVVVFPVKRAWVAVASRVKSTPRNAGPGILKLHNDVQTCEYEDVQVMWEMLRTEMEVSSQTAKRKQPFSRAVVWSDRATGIEQRHHR